MHEVMIDGVQYVPADDFTGDGESQPEQEEGLKPGYVSEHFREAEFACNHCGELPADGMHPVLIDWLEKVREHFGRPVVINSGYRCKTHNKNVGGASNSQHLYGTAADLRVSGVAPSKVYAWLNEQRQGKGGLGSYANFTHLDVGPDGRRWKG